AERQSLAFSSDRGRTWTKFAGNPVLGDDRSREFRDPRVFWHAPTERWVMIVGVRHRLYASDDLRHWKLLGETGFESECPDLFPLPLDGDGGTKWVLSLAGRRYVLGVFDGERFAAETGPRPVDGGNDFYAAQS
ncbi:MAG: glycoside hydrolase family 32 protein, partial [Planctomycetota bacterium]|nr:glycoside hydrolase family 32 protein [Planctomycetota bacterium]